MPRKERGMRLPINLPLTSTTLLIAGGIFLLVLFVVGVLFSFAPNLYIGYAAKKRVKSFNNQLGDGITLMGNSLRSGYSFLQSMDLVSREAPAPMSSEFRRVVQEIGLGLSTEEALAN